MLLPNDQVLIAQLERDEGIRNKPYLDTVGKVTIGVGRNLDDKGLSQEEIGFLLQNDITDSLKEAKKFAWFEGLDLERQRVVVNMIFNLGPFRFKRFRKMLEALAKQDYKTARDEMLDSRWAVQVGSRADRLAEIMFPKGG
jgi:lysozyme